MHILKIKRVSCSSSVVENITVNNPIVIKNITYGTSIVPIEIGADYSTARVGMTIDGVAYCFDKSNSKDKYSV